MDVYYPTGKCLPHMYSGKDIAFYELVRLIEGGVWECRSNFSRHSRGDSSCLRLVLGR